MMTKRIILVLLLIIPGILVAAICSHYALKDWVALQDSYRQYEIVAASNSSMHNLFVAHAKQNIHRINLFADGVWAMLGSILAGTGIHGLCSISKT
ncbi:hypothetical protein LLG46_07985 [bacterium]|nr:hypothetical protein [bacterium]